MTGWLYVMQNFGDREGYVMGLWDGLIWLRLELGGRLLCEHGKSHVGSIKGLSGIIR
jgi:hypothetical protein